MNFRLFIFSIVNVPSACAGNINIVKRSYKSADYDTCLNRIVNKSSFSFTFS
jgi:hypothetical protein